MTGTDKPSRKGRLFKWVLVVSLGLNLVVIGVFAGAALRFSGGDKDGRFHEARILSSGTAFVRALPKEARRDLREAMRQGGGKDLPSRGEQRAIFEQMVTALRQDPFDLDQVRALLNAQGEFSHEIRERGQEGWLKVVAQMSASERAQVADRLEKGLHHKGEKKPKPERD